MPHLTSCCIFCPNCKASILYELTNKRICNTCPKALVSSSSQIVFCCIHPAKPCRLQCRDWQSRASLTIKYCKFAMCECRRHVDWPCIWCHCSMAAELDASERCWQGSTDLPHSGCCLPVLLCGKQPSKCIRSAVLPVAVLAVSSCLWWKLQQLYSSDFILFWHFPLPGVPPWCDRQQF